MNNIFSAIPAQLDAELCEELLGAGNCRIERIVSQGHSSPAQGWYEQDEHEWVMVVQGAGKIVFADGKEQTLHAGDYLNIAAGVKHKVVWTAPDEPTLWLTVFYRD